MWCGAAQFLSVEQMKHTVSIDTITSTGEDEHFFQSNARLTQAIDRDTV